MEMSLREKRLVLSLSLLEIASATRIRESCLKAIEEGDFRILPVPVYTRSYIRRYAEFLGIPPDKTLAAYEDYCSQAGQESAGMIQDNRQSPVRHDTKCYCGNENIPNRQGISKRLRGQFIEQRKVTLAVVLLLAIVLVSAFVGRKQPFSLHDPKIQPAVHIPPTETALPDRPDTMPGLNSPDGTEVRPAAVSQFSKKHHINLSATDKVWVQVILDSADKREMIMNAGDSVSYDADATVFLWIGNAGNLKITHNGRVMEEVGKKGQVRKIRIPDLPSLPEEKRKRETGTPEMRTGSDRAQAAGTENEKTTGPKLDKTSQNAPGENSARHDEISLPSQGIQKIPQNH